MLNAQTWRRARATSVLIAFDSDNEDGAQAQTPAHPIDQGLCVGSYVGLTVPSRFATSNNVG